ncbi:indolepyruvate ferredoxin oxidoreductase family protein [Desertibaculum subflavum]|uniref:indolepyruvate ferredoxin oxidoreductase family protein n=1 Tax=Desertibaculum subflavum TaxID=2268458 RepID=UPI000E66ECEC
MALSPKLKADVTLDDKYALEQGRVFLTGMQALVRLPLMQRQRDLKAGLNTAGYVSGYRGSPLAGYDQALWRAKKFLKNGHIHFEAGLNEEAAATACWGSQQTALYPQSAKYDGVFALWYGKAPGLDRAMDAIRHGNLAGTSRHGGVICLTGDDHNASSSTVACQSDINYAALALPYLYPANVREYLEYGLYAFALGRFAGTWVGFKCLTETADSSASVNSDPNALEIVTPADFAMPPGGLHIRWPHTFLEQEALHHNYRMPAVGAFWRANRIDRQVFGARDARLGIVTAGKSYLDTRQALDDLGIDEAIAAEVGLAIYKVGMVWPLEPEGIRDFARGKQELLVVEEKRGVIEEQLKGVLYDLPADQRPRIAGKQDETGRMLLPATGELSAAMVAKALVARLPDLARHAHVRERLAVIAEKEADLAAYQPKTVRTPFFCSGCPHNTSTRVPEGSRALAGIGCHFMSVWMNRNTSTYSQMGGEGVAWLGQAPFTEDKHVFANLGDGTYLHSGALAVRAAVQAGANITYKILFNDAVAMTGGQPMSLTPAQITQQVYGEGVKKIVVVTDEPDKYPAGYQWAPGVTVHHRDRLDTIQKELREIQGTTVLLYDQTCAAEKRRRRKTGKFPDPPKRAFINDAVCEGCGDCSVKSNCISVEPLETPFGRKRKINQSSCNKDFSCINGFCPSFVTVHGGSIRRARVAKQESPLEAMIARLPAPEVAAVTEPYDILVTGIGGTGVVTIGALLGMAAHLEGKGVSVLDQIGLAQKNGAVVTHVRVAAQPDEIHAVRVATAKADLLLGCDMVVSAGMEAMTRIGRGRTHALVNAAMAPTAGFTLDTGIDFHEREIAEQVKQAAGHNLTEFVEATRLATALMGDAIASNMFMLGYAAQRGLLPVSLAAIDKAIELNGAAVEMNRQAFAWGRAAAVDPKAVEAAAAPSLPPAPESADETLAEIVARRVRFLTEYQDAAYARRYSDLVALAGAAEEKQAKGLAGFAEAVAQGAFKLMAYKDEYEVARLYTDGEFEKKLRAQFDGEFKLKFHLAPPLLARRDPATGELQKGEYGPWVFKAFKLLAGLRRLRGTWADIFGYTAERKMERRLIEDYEALVRELAAKLDRGNHALAVELASTPEEIRGFGHVKERSVAKAKEKQVRLLAAFRSPPAPALAAE